MKYQLFILVLLIASCGNETTQELTAGPKVLGTFAHLAEAAAAQQAEPEEHKSQNKGLRFLTAKTMIKRHLFKKKEPAPE